MNGKEDMIKAHVIKAVILSYFRILIRVTVKCEGRPEQNRNPDEILFMCAHSKEEKEVCFLYCHEPLIINLRINIYKICM